MNEHANRDHAILSPSSAKRWINCTPSALLAEEAGSKSSSYADEGTLAHEIAEYALRQYYMGAWEPTLDEEFPIEPERLESKYYSIEMSKYIRSYCEFVIDENYSMQKRDGRCGMAFEEKVDISKYAPGSFGSVDVSLFGSTEIHIIDLKYGAGVKVSAYQNEQLMMYALGVLDMMKDKSIKTVRMTIAQVRLDHYDTFEISRQDLMSWGRKVLKPKAELAIKGEGMSKVGEWCRFCPVKATCRAHYNEVMADFDDKPEPLLLTEEEITALIGKIDTYKSWLESVNQYVYSEAMNGRKWPGYKLIAGRSMRVIVDEEKIRQALLKEYMDDEIFNIKLKGIGDLEKLVGKKVFNSRFGDCIVSKPGAPKLVTEDSKGEEFCPLSDFDVEA